MAKIETQLYEHRKTGRRVRLEASQHGSDAWPSSDYKLCKYQGPTLAMGKHAGELVNNVAPAVKLDSWLAEPYHPATPTPAIIEHKLSPAQVFEAEIAAEVAKEFAELDLRNGDFVPVPKSKSSALVRYVVAKRRRILAASAWAAGGVLVLELGRFLARFIGTL